MQRKKWKSFTVTLMCLSTCTLLIANIGLSYSKTKSMTSTNSYVLPANTVKGGSRTVEIACIAEWIGLHIENILAFFSALISPSGSRCCASPFVIKEREKGGNRQTRLRQAFLLQIHKNKNHLIWAVLLPSPSPSPAAPPAPSPPDVPQRRKFHSDSRTAWRKESEQK